MALSQEGQDMEQLLTVEQVADRLQVNEQTVRRWLRERELVGIAFGGRTGWRVSEDDLQAFLDRRRMAEGGEQTKKLAA
ncbi:MAG TPA: helix-turn-helix domain-containing protein [Chloroflexota bacterium]|nr:helix-turn-helix domain-containing protein [Chloroflexota bacterium]